MGSTERFTASDGIAIAYRQWGTPGGVPVILHHGFAADSQTNWVAPGVIAALVETRRWVVALDARGHGNSDKPHDPAMYGEAKMAADVSTLADVLGVEQFDMVGYSHHGPRRSPPRSPALGCSSSLAPTCRPWGRRTSASTSSPSSMRHDGPGGLPDPWANGGADAPPRGQPVELCHGGQGGDGRRGT